MQLKDVTPIIKEILAERDKIPVIHNMERYIPHWTPWHAGDFMRGGIRKALRIIEQAPVVDAVKVDGNTSDGYHTFNELYDHRAKLFSVIVRNYPDLCWKSKQHHDGTMYDGMFIVGIDTPDGQASYHYDIDPYWSIFDCKELERAPVWDGHTPQQAIDRIAALQKTKDAAPVVRCKDCWKRGNEIHCPMCYDEWFYDEDDGNDFVTRDNTVDDGFCHVGAKMDGGAEG